MSLVPQGVSGSAGFSTTLSPSTYGTLVTPGATYALGRWTGQTLRKLVLGIIGARTNVVIGRIQIANTYPTAGRHPLTDAVPNPQFDLVLTSSDSPLVLDFEPGLVTVLPGESLYLVLYDFYATGSGYELMWTLNMLWEPMKEE